MPSTVPVRGTRSLRLHDGRQGVLVLSTLMCMHDVQDMWETHEALLMYGCAEVAAALRSLSRRTLLNLFR